MTVQNNSDRRERTDPIWWAPVLITLVSDRAGLVMEPGAKVRNVGAEIKSSTAFGAKYVDLVVPGSGASPARQR
jgi:phospholipid/cholesterol/gamma-HCH transport system substrate-binding protein